MALSSESGWEIDYRIFDAGLKEIDNVRPLSIIPIWVDGLLLNTCTPVMAEEVKRIWNELVDEFLRLDFLKARPFGSSLLIKLGFKISKELPMSGLSNVAAWFSSKFGGGAERKLLSICYAREELH